MSIKIIIAIVVFVGIGGVALYVFNGDIDSDRDGLPEVEVGSGDTEQRDSVTKNQFEEMKARGQSMKCDFTDVQNDTQSEGVFYFDYKNNRTRVDVTSILEGKPFTTHMVNDGEHIYTWGTDMDQGTMMSADVTKVKDSIPFSGEYESIINQQQETDDTSYTCTVWNADDGVFVPDTTVEFIDMSAMIDGMSADTLKDFDPAILENLENI